MKLLKLSMLGVACAIVALCVPGLATAHPGVYTVTANIAKSPERQTITVDATGGTFKPSSASSSVAFDATAFQVQLALDADPAIGFDNVAVTGDPGGPYTLQYEGTLAGVNVAQVVPDASGLTGGAQTAVAATALEGGTAVVYPSVNDMATQVQAVIANDGYAVGVRETNGLATGGMLNYKVIPTAFRATMTTDQKRTWGPAQTSYQLHATCQGVPALSSSANILAWQPRSDNDIFFNYIPFQKTSAGVGDDPTAWIPVVKSATGVDLSTLSTVSDFTTACQNLGGTYTPADTVSNITSAAVADGIKPVQAQVDALTADKTALQSSLDTANAQITSLQGDKSSLQAENTGLKNDKASLTTANAQLQAQLAAAAKANKKQDAKIKSLQKQIKRLKKKG